MTTQLNNDTSTKKGFTLIELIFTIVIIGVLAAVAIPKYKNLKDNAEYNKMVKTLSDVTGSVPSAYYNAVYLNSEDPNTLTIDKLVNIKGNGWTEESDNIYTYNKSNSRLYAFFFYPARKQFHAYVYCYNMPSTLQNKCNEQFPRNVPGKRYNRQIIEL